MRSRGVRDALPAEHRRERGAEAHEPAGERQAVQASGGFGMRPSRSEPSTPANAQKRSQTITTPFGPRHPAQAGQREGGVTAAEHGRCRIHTPVVSDKWAAPRGRDGPSFDVESSPTARLPDAAREEAEQSQYQDDDQDDPENSHV